MFKKKKKLIYTILSLNGVWESSFLSSIDSKASPLRYKSSFTFDPFALILRNICRLNDPKVSLLCVNISTSSALRPGFAKRIISDRCFPRTAL